VTRTAAQHTARRADEQSVAPDRRVVRLWLGTRVWLSLWVLICSATYPLSTLEKALPAWPPQLPVGQWIDRVLVEPWNRWDVEHFHRIATEGYRLDDGTLSFHPLFPLLGRAIGALVGGDALWGLFIAANICSLLFLLALGRLARLDLSPDDAFRACVSFLMLPAAFIIFAPYTESLFLLCSVLALLMARRGRWMYAGLMGALATLTRQQGILLLLPLAWEFWEAARRDWREVLHRWPAALSLAITPMGLGLWLLYRNWALGDLQFDWREPQTLLHGFVISSSASRVVPGQQLVFPWQALWLALRHPGATNLIDLSTGGVYLGLLVVGFRRLWALRPSYLLYTVATVAVSFSYSTGLPYSYISLARHCLLAFPLALLLPALTRNRVVAFAMTAIGVTSLLGLSLLYVWHILWVP
jgi:hypothetical protein